MHWGVEKVKNEQKTTSSIGDAVCDCTGDAFDVQQCSWSNAS
jgi:hypothetical protein